MQKAIKQTTNKLLTVSVIVVGLAVGAGLLVDAGTAFNLDDMVLGLVGATIFVGSIYKLTKSV